MKQVLALAAVLIIAGATLYYAQHRKHADAVSANAVVDVAADWQRDISRVPMRVTRISDQQEERIGDELAQRYESGDSANTAEARATEHYINEVGRRVANHAKRKLPFHFHLVSDGALPFEEARRYTHTRNTSSLRNFS